MTWIVLWLISVVFVWRGAHEGKRRLEFRHEITAQYLSSILTGLYIAYAFAPSAVSAGFVAVPLPATLALTSELLQRPVEWREVRFNVVSFITTFVVVTAVHFPFARASRRRREADVRFEAEQQQKNKANSDR